MYDKSMWDESVKSYSVTKMKLKKSQWTRDKEKELASEIAVVLNQDFVFGRKRHDATDELLCTITETELTENSHERPTTPRILLRNVSSNPFTPVFS